MKYHVQPKPDPNGKVAIPISVWPDPMTLRRMEFARWLASHGRINEGR